LTRYEIIVSILHINQKHFFYLKVGITTFDTSTQTGFIVYDMPMQLLFTHCFAHRFVF